jgi:hypothetical protein
LQEKQGVLAGDKPFFVNDEGVLLGTYFKQNVVLFFISPICRTYHEQGWKSSLAISRSYRVG